MAVKRCRNICDLPEDCLANVFALTTPKDVCRVSAVSSTFRSAADSDSVWERFVPSDHRDIISRSINGPESLLREVQSRKDLYLRLSDPPILIDSGLKSFNLDKCSGKKCYMLAARDLSIAWGDTPQYWQWKSHPKSRFSEVAQLRHVCWLEIRGYINSNMLSFGTNYAAYLLFRLKVKPKRYGFDHLCAEACVGIKGLGMDKRRVFLDPNGAQRQEHLERQQDGAETEDNNQFLKRRADGWMEVELGEYFVMGGDDDIVEMSLLEVKILNWKSGLIIQGIEIRPKECVPPYQSLFLSQVHVQNL